MDCKVQCSSAISGKSGFLHFLFVLPYPVCVDLQYEFNGRGCFKYFKNFYAKFIEILRLFDIPLSSFVDLYFYQKNICFQFFF